MSQAEIPLRTIQEISGHKTLLEQQKYLEVSAVQKAQAISVLDFQWRPLKCDLDCPVYLLSSSSACFSTQLCRKLDT